MNTQELLTKARELITDPECWTQRAYGHTKNGEAVWVTRMGSAVKMCAIGALYKANNGSLDLIPEAKNELEASILQAGDESRLHVFNDNSTHEEVLDLFDATIERLSEK